MLAKLKAILNDPRIWQVLATALLGYFGYTEVEQRRSVEPPVIPQITSLSLFLSLSPVSA